MVMSPPTDPVKPVPLDEPVRLCLASGGTFYGMPVRRVVLELEDGRSQAMELPIPAAPTVGSDGDLTDQQRDILDAVEELPVGHMCDNIEILRRAGHLAESGTPSGPQREFIKSLEPRLLKRSNRGWKRV